MMLTTTRKRLTVAAAAFAIAACSDQGPDLDAATETWSLASIGGQSLPLDVRDPGATGDLVTVRAGRVVIAPSADRSAIDAHRGRVLHLHTSARIVRTGATGAGEVVAEGESDAMYFFDRTAGMIVPWQVVDGVRTEAPFTFEVSGRSLVMRSTRGALEGWRYTR